MKNVAIKVHTLDTKALCPKYYSAELAAKADADTLRACWTLIKTVELGKIA